MEKETEGQKHRRLFIEYTKLLDSFSGGSMSKIEEYKEKLDRIESIFVGRNLDGRELEKAGKVDEAIALYEKNIKEGCDGSHPYTRLAIIYRKRKLFEEVSRVIKKVEERKSIFGGD